MKHIWSILLVLLAVAPAVQAQTLSGSVALLGVAGYQTNPYLDPMLGVWDSSQPPAFAGVMPSGGLWWTSSDWQFSINMAGRVDQLGAGQTAATAAQFNGTGKYTIAPQWSMGFQGGWHGYTLTESRYTRWLLPELEWEITDRTTSKLQGGWTGQTVTHPQGQQVTYNSGLLTLQVRQWLSSRLRGKAGVYLSGSRAAAQATRYGGSGASLGVTYWLTNHISWQLQARVERTAYKRLQTDETGGNTYSTQKDLFWKGGSRLNWQVNPNVTAFARGCFMAATSSFASQQSYDMHLSGGLQLQLNAPLWKAVRNKPSLPLLWKKTPAGMRLTVKYSGPGRLYVTGEFNNWADPGWRLEQTSSSRHVVTLPLPDGRYQYRLRVVTEAEAHWLSLPDDAHTVQDGFGSVNGVVTVN